MNLRPYQTEAVEAAIEHLQRNRSTLLVMPTGSGKTIVFGHLIRQLGAAGRSMVVAHREELLSQAQDKIETVTGTRPDLEMADSVATEGLLCSPIVAASVQTLNAGRNGSRRMLRFDPADFRLLVIDEAHHAVADTYRRVLDHFAQNPECRVLGVTATPDRHDEEALGKIFDTCAYEYSIQDAILEGWLVPVRQQFLEVQVDLSGVHIVLGDLHGRELREVLAQGSTLEHIASDSVQHVEARRTLVFSDSVENAERLMVAFNRWRAGCARIVTGETPRDERRALIQDYRDGRFQFLVNVSVATEGFDVPDISAIIMARPTCSRSLYAQELGRGTRPLAGVVDGQPDAQNRVAAILASPKANLLVLDLVGNSCRHTLVHAADVLAGRTTERQVQLATQLIQEHGGDMDVLEALEEAERRTNAELEAEAKHAEALRLRRKSHARDIDPFGVFGIMRRVARGWELGKPVSDEQRAKLDKWRIPTPPNADYGTAQQLIDEVRSRTRRGLCTFRQKIFLERKGIDASRMRFETAHALIDQFAAKEGWGK